MELDEFYETIEARLSDLDINAKDAAHAVLAALALRLQHEEAMELAGELPDALADLLADANGELDFERDGFIEDVASRLDADDVDAERASLAVLRAIRQALEPSPEQVIETLPSDLAQLMHGAD